MATIEITGSTTLQRRTRLARVAAMVLFTAVVGVLVAACHSGSNSPSVARVTSTSPSTSPSASSGPTGGAGGGSGNQPGGQQIGGAGGGITVAYSTCMRSHGVAKFPDPDSNGTITIPAGIDPQSPTYQAAQQTCQKYLSGAAPNPSQSAQARADALKFSQCMRSHGITNFPDPDAQGHIGISSSSGINQQSAAFQAAQKACSPLMGNPGGGS